jgi:hypothetical protein
VGIEDLILTRDLGSILSLLSPVLGRKFQLTLLHRHGIIVHKGNLLSAAVEVFYKRKFDVLCERVAGGRFLCHSLTCASQCEVTCGDRVTPGTSNFFCPDKTGSLFCVDSGHKSGLFWKKKNGSPHVFLDVVVWYEPPAPTSSADKLDLW